MKNKRWRAHLPFRQLTCFRVTVNNQQEHAVLDCNHIMRDAGVENNEISSEHIQYLSKRTDSDMTRYCRTMIFPGAVCSCHLESAFILTSSTRKDGREASDRVVRPFVVSGSAFRASISERKSNEKARRSAWTFGSPCESSIAGVLDMTIYVMRDGRRALL